jgi:hypothetical protein
VSLKIYEKANKYLLQEGIRYTGKKENKMWFEVIGNSDTHLVSLELIKVGNGFGVYQKKWTCTCKGSSTVGMLHNATCAHIESCIGFCVLNPKVIK